MARQLTLGARPSDRPQSSGIGGKEKLWKGKTFSFTLMRMKE